MRLRFAVMVVSVVGASLSALSFPACANTDPRPDASSGTSSSTSSTSSSSGGSSSGVVDAQVDAEVDAGQDAALPNECANTIRDGNETDVDCGGNACAQCIDGKKCVANTDCKGGFCNNKVCVTAKCTDKLTNGDESDTDCGGTVCAKCTIGKRCAVNEDCVSGSCAGSVCRCGKGMTEVPRATGGAYCVDAIEVTKAMYNKFLTAGVPIADQPTECAGNTDFVPRGAWPPAAAPPYIAPNGRGFNYSLPVHYVDWCDAHAYCEWAGKQLCGRINGGPISPTAANDADEDAWYNACSQQGQKKFPYGDTYATKCNDTGNGTQGPLPTNAGFGFAENEDDGVYQLVVFINDQGDFTDYANAQCQGGVTDLFQMSGNVAEWEDSCQGSAANTKCRLRGGSYAANATESLLSCNAVREEDRLPVDASVLKDVGFRCCLY